MTPMDRVLLNHEWVRRLGSGGFGEVWLARHTTLKQYRAVKGIRPDRFSPEGVAKLEREAGVMAQLRPHRNRVQVFELQPDSLRGPLVVMQYVDGAALSGA